MKELIMLFMFMTLPIWIPVIGTTSGMLADLIRARRGITEGPTIAERLQERRAAEASASAQVDTSHSVEAVAA